MEKELERSQAREEGGSGHSNVTCAAVPEEREGEVKKEVEMGRGNRGGAAETLIR